MSEPPADEDVDAGQPLDPDVGPAPATTPPTAALLLVIAVGGVVGSLARWAVAVALPTHPGSMPWSTLTVNVVGSLALGVLMARLAAAAHPSPYVRPFVGVGVLGGFTTFSTFATDLRSLVAGGHAGTGAAYLLASVFVCLLATAGGLRLGRSRA